MERLTFEGNFCDIAQCDVIPGGSSCESGSCTQRKVWERLKAYEDTRLTPERCAEFARADAEGRYIVMHDAEQEGVARLRELAEADRDGRLVVLPCKVGDTVYRLFAGNPDNPVIATLKINTVPEAVKLIGKMGMHKYIGTFLTREAAEKALEAMEDE